MLSDYSPEEKEKTIVDEVRLVHHVEETKKKKKTKKHENEHCKKCEMMNEENYAIIREMR